MVRTTLTALLGVFIAAVGLLAWIIPIVPGAPIFFIGLGMAIGWHPVGNKLVLSLKAKMKRKLTRWGLYYRSAKVIERDLFRPEEAKLTTSTPSAIKND